MSVHPGLHRSNTLKFPVLRAPSRTSGERAAGGDPVAGCALAVVLSLAVWALIGTAAFLI